MPFALKYPSGEVEKPDAHEAAQQAKYLERDGHVPIRVFDPEGYEISLDELGELALNQFRTK